MKLKDSINIVSRLIDKLQGDFLEIINFKPQFNVYKLKEGQYNANCYKRGFTFNFDLLFNAGESLPYIFIIKLEVSPKGEGRGTLLMEHFKLRIKEEVFFNKIYISSLNQRTDHFWSRLGFNHIAAEDHHVFKNYTCNPNMVCCLIKSD